jgi:hypothetical protein
MEEEDLGEWFNTVGGQACWGEGIRDEALVRRKDGGWGGGGENAREAGRSSKYRGGMAGGEVVLFGGV